MLVYRVSTTLQQNIREIAYLKWLSAFGIGPLAEPTSGIRTQMHMHVKNLLPAFFPYVNADKVAL